MIPEYGGKDWQDAIEFGRRTLSRQQVKTDSDGGPEGSYEQEGKQQPLSELQAGGLACGPRRIVGVVNPIERWKLVETPHKLATIQ
jgi:hypothetical protein